MNALDALGNPVRREILAELRGAPMPVGELALEFVPQYAEAGAAIEDVDLISQTHFDAGGIAPIAQVLGLWSGRGAAYAPKLNSHKFRCFLIPCF